MTLFFLAAGNKKFQWAIATAIAYDANEYPPDYWLKTVWAQDSQTRTWLVDSLFCITCSLKNNAFSVLHYVMKIALNYYMVHQFEIFSASGTIAHCSIRLPPCSLVSLRGCSLAIIWEECLLLFIQDISPFVIGLNPPAS